KEEKRAKKKSGRFYLSPLLTSLLSLSSPMEQPQGPALHLPAASSPPSDNEFDHDEDHHDFSPVGSPELTESHFP
ncbi:hypothetical protein, partial [Salmonella enterica]|uniref:hypothetical protein n=1 Tax=Salmonella enterica TaxID=28901 RepID=UPI00329A1129